MNNVAHDFVSTVLLCVEEGAKRALAILAAIPFRANVPTSAS
jgi:hypothetical protein